MPAQSRVSDIAHCPADSHGCPACPHPVTGPAIGGSPDVTVNGLPALRIDDPGLHAACCAGGRWTVSAGSGTVFINGKKAARKGDSTKHCGGNGSLKKGSSDVFTGG
jgi:uncharacterized Zn-binding protein involved in type VI secretion